MRHGSRNFHFLHKRALVGAALALAAIVFQYGLQSALRPYAIDGLYFQRLSSESMMQTVSIDDLYAAPLESLVNLHIQPPALDTIRALLIHIWPATGPDQRVRHVDLLLYRLWTVVYGLLGLTLFFWACQLTDTSTALLVSIGFLMHPATIGYTTFLDATLLTTLLILVTYFLLWQLKNRPGGSIGWFTLATLALFFTRPIFQWFSVLVFAVSLLLLRTSTRSVLMFLVIAGGVVGMYTLKQYVQFGIASTSSFTGLNLTRSIAVETHVDYWKYLERLSDQGEISAPLPSVLARRVKANGTINFNNHAYLALNQRLISVYWRALLVRPPSQLITSYAQNLGLYLRPSSQYTAHVIVDRLPWRRPYDRVFSAPLLPIIVGISGLVWGVRARKRGTLRSDSALLLPGLYIFLVSVLGEKGENMRFKFFLEPVVYLFCVAQLAALTRGAYAAMRPKLSWRG